MHVRIYREFHKKKCNLLSSAVVSFLNTPHNNELYLFEKYISGVTGSAFKIFLKSNQNFFTFYFVSLWLLLNKFIIAQGVANRCFSHFIKKAVNKHKKRHDI